MVDEGDPNGLKARPEEMLSNEQRKPMENPKDEALDLEREKREKIWSQMEAYLQRHAEGWGGIETGITDTVVALNLMSIYTDQSCEGHQGQWALAKGWPFVEIAEKDAEHARDLIDEFYKTQQKRKSEKEKIILRVKDWGKDGMRYFIESRGAGENLPLSVASVLLFSYQKWIQKIESINHSYTREMEEFTNFLKKKFFSSDYHLETVDYGKTLRGRFGLMSMEELAKSKELGIWDSEESEAMRFPVPENSASGNPWVNAVPGDAIEKLGPFLTRTSPESHVGPFKNSVDFLVPDGTSVLAMHDGTIVEVKDDSERWGNDPSFRNDLNYITIFYPENKGFFCQYSHLKKDSVKFKVGEYVHAGQQIGVVGKSGWTDRDQLRVAVYEHDKRPENPFGFKSLKINWGVERTDNS